MFFFLSKILDVFIGPYVWGLVLLLAGTPWRGAQAHTWRARRAMSASGFILLWASSMEPVANWLQWRLEHASPPTYHPDTPYDVALLLGGVTDERVTAETGQPAYSDAVERLTKTYELLRDGKARFAIVSAAGADPRRQAFSETRVLVHQLADWGIDPARLIIEDRARNTRENATYTKEIVRARHFGRVLVVTSAWHMPRAVECFAAVHLDVDTFSVDYRAHELGVPPLSNFMPRPQWLAQTTMALREILGRYVYRLQGYGKAQPG